MNRKTTNLMITALFLLAVLNIQAQITAFNFQGRLNDGANPANGRYDLQFKLFDAISGGNQVFATVDRPNLMLVNGVFSTTLDFGVSAFDTGTRFVEISVRPNGSPNEYVILGGRQQILSVPFAVRAATAQNAQTLEGQTSGDFIKNSTAAQTANFNITGNGTVGGNLGVGVTPQPGTKLDVAGNATFRTANGDVNIGSPNGETGVTITGANRADFRFDGFSLKIVAGLGTGIPSDINGLAINTSGRVGIGTLVPTARLDVVKTEFDSVAIRAFSSTFSGTPILVENSAGGPAIRALGDIFVSEDISQGAFGNGLVKAMLHVRPATPFGNPTIVRCYNGFIGGTTGTCNFSVTAAPGLVGVWKIDFGFDITTRNPSITAEYASGCNLVTGVCGGFGRNFGANFRLFNATTLEVFTFDSGNSADTAPAAFVITLF